MNTNELFRIPIRVSAYRTKNIILPDCLNHLSSGIMKQLSKIARTLVFKQPIPCNDFQFAFIKSQFFQVSHQYTSCNPSCDPSPSPTYIMIVKRIIIQTVRGSFSTFSCLRARKPQGISKSRELLAEWSTLNPPAFKNPISTITSPPPLTIRKGGWKTFWMHSGHEIMPQNRLDQASKDAKTKELPRSVPYEMSNLFWIP